MGSLWSNGGDCLCIGLQYPLSLRKVPKMSSATVEQPVSAKKSIWKRLTPVFVLVALFVAFFATGLNEYVSFEALRDHRVFLQEFVAQNLILAVAIYIAIYTVVVAASLPGALFLTVFGGFLFGSLAATTWTVFAATLGATVIFLVARHAAGDAIRAKAGGKIEGLLAGFEKDAFSYLMVLRLVPLFPFFVVNVAPAFAAVPLRTFVVTTFLGIIPGTFVYAQVGTGLGSIFDAGETFSASGILTPEILIALVGLAALSCIPIVYKRFKKS